VAKQRGRKYAKYTEEFRRHAVERMKVSDNLNALARELGVDHKLLYEWRERAADLSDQRSPANRKTRQLEQENKNLKRLLAEKTLELDFFSGALQKVAARRQPSGVNGETASTTKSGK
jgi:transposase-like protein